MTTSCNPYVFAVGCPRSGTTLLQRMLDHHPRLAVANDTHFIPHALAGFPQRVDPPLTLELVSRVRSYRRFPRLGLSDEDVERAAAGARTFSDFVAGLYSRFGQLRGKQLAGEKTPDYVRFLPLLQALFPRARTLHIIRDGRDVCLSALEWATETKGPGKLELWREEPVAVCALWWRRNVSRGRNDGPGLGAHRYREVRYETLVSNPVDELEKIAAFLDLPFAPEMAAYHVGRTRDEPGLSAKSAWLPPTPRLRDWRSAMSDRNVELFEALAGDLLAELGYGRATASISPSIAQVAERCNERWHAEMERRPLALHTREVPGSTPMRP
jgi:hypothetical protein